jgi:hypothetical protein
MVCAKGWMGPVAEKIRPAFEHDGNRLNGPWPMLSAFQQAGFWRGI